MALCAECGRGCVLNAQRQVDTREADCVKRAVLPERLLANAGPCMFTLQNTAGLRRCVGARERACVSHRTGTSASVTVRPLGFVRSLTADGHADSFPLPCSCRLFRLLYIRTKSPL